MTWDTSARRSRRSFLKTSAVTGVIGRFSTGVAAQETTEQFELNAVTDGWEGEHPIRLYGATNPPLDVWEGTFEVLWENQDGNPHNLVVENAEGTIIAESGLIENEGSTGNISVDISLGDESPPVQYYCSEYPNTMQGEFRLHEYDIHTERHAQVEFTDQESDGGTVSVDRVDFPINAGYVALYKGEPFLDLDGEVGGGDPWLTQAENLWSDRAEDLFLGVSDFLHIGEHTDVQVPLSSELASETERSIAAVPHIHEALEWNGPSDGTVFQEPFGRIEIKLATVTGTSEKKIDTVIESKRSLAADIDNDAAYFSELDEIESLLASYQDEFQKGTFENEDVPVNAIRRLIQGERISRRLIHTTSEAELVGGQPQLAVRTTEFTIKLAISILMIQISFVDYLNNTRLGSLIPDGEFLQQALDSAFRDLVMTGFSAAQEDEVITTIEDVVEDILNKDLSNEFESAEQFSDRVIDQVTSLVSDFTLQQTIETGEGFGVFSSNLPLDIISRFTNIESGIAFMNENLDPGTIQNDGLKGTHKGAVEASSRSQDHLEDVASTTETFLDELDSGLDFLGVFENIYELLTRTDEIPLWEAAGLISSIVTHAGLASSVVRTIGTIVGETTIRLLMTIHARGIYGVYQGDPVTFEDINDILPNVDNTLEEVASVEERWGRSLFEWG